MTDPSGSRPTRALVIEPAVSPLPTTHTSTGPPAESAAPAVQKLRPSRMRGWWSG